MIDMYCGVDDTQWKKDRIFLHNKLCISPIYGKNSNKKTETRVNVLMANNMKIIQDSGAFVDGIIDRLSFSDALLRQNLHSNKYKYTKYISSIATYDLLIDEKWDINGNRYKCRWSEDEANFAVNETIESAYWLNNHRNGKSLILSCQGITTKQYLKCAKEIIKYYIDGDSIGLGGWCILGIKRNTIKASFIEIIENLIPFLASNYVNKIHIWGTVYAPALGNLLWLCDAYNITLSTDSSGVHRKPIYGNWGYANWINKNYMRPQNDNIKLKKERVLHVRHTSNWLKNFRATKYYTKPNNEKWRI